MNISPVAETNLVFEPAVTWTTWELIQCGGFLSACPISANTISAIYMLATISAFLTFISPFSADLTAKKPNVLMNHNLIVSSVA